MKSAVGCWIYIQTLCRGWSYGYLTRTALDAIDCTRLQAELGWSPRESFESGLRRTVQWYLDNSAWVERVTTGSYRRQRLGTLNGGPDSGR